MHRAFTFDDIKRLIRIMTVHVVGVSRPGVHVEPCMKTAGVKDYFSFSSRAIFAMSMTSIGIVPPMRAECDEAISTADRLSIAL